MSKKKFYSNKIDTIKLTFDSRFNDIDEESIIEVEILRQIDKSINNSIGTFHEQVLGGIHGYEVGNLSGFDIKAEDDTLFADIVYDKIPRKFEESIFFKFANASKYYKNAKFYLVTVNTDKSYSRQWEVLKEESRISQKRVYNISIDMFYDLLARQNECMKALSSALPIALKDYLSNSN